MQHHPTGSGGTMPPPLVGPLEAYRVVQPEIFSASPGESRRTDSTTPSRTVSWVIGARARRSGRRISARPSSNVKTDRRPSLRRLARLFRTTSRLGSLMQIRFASTNVCPFRIRLQLLMSLNGP